MVDAEGENFVSWFSRAEDNAFLSTCLKNFVFVSHVFCSAERWRGHGPPALPPVARALYKSLNT